MLSVQGRGSRRRLVRVLALLPRGGGAVDAHPALAVDRNGMRLGYGGGCYDRLLSQPGWSTLPTFAVLPEACVHPTLLPAEPWDQPLDGWITEQGCSLRRASH